MVSSNEGSASMHYDPEVKIYFADFFGVHPDIIEDYGALNISLIADLPLFIDPFLLFHSQKPEYQQLHEQILAYLTFLHDHSTSRQAVDPGLIKAWYMFGEIKQTWLGFSQSGNGGRGLGNRFANKLDGNLRQLFTTWGQEKVTQSSHLEKLCLIERGVGADSISDYTTNLIVGYLASYTEAFARDNLTPEQCRKVSVPKAEFDYETEKWYDKTFFLPWFENDFVLLTPRDILMQENTWINRNDLNANFSDLPSIIDNAQLRASINNYFLKQLPKRTKKDKNGNEKEVAPSKAEREDAILGTLRQFPILIDYFIRYKEENGDKAVSLSQEQVQFIEHVFIGMAESLALQLSATTEFYRAPQNSYEDAMQRLQYLKHVIENQDGYRFFYIDGEPLKRERDVQLLYKLVWFGTPRDVNSEVNNGRGPVDFKISTGARDKCLVEFKLASNTALKKNLQHQVEIYQKANQTDKAIKAILYFSEAELEKTNAVLKELGLEHEEAIVLIDARADNKPSASVATSH